VQVKVSVLVPVRPLPLVDLALGVILIAAIGFAAGQSWPAAQERRHQLLGWLLVTVPLPLVVSVRLVFPTAALGSQGAFVCAVLAFAAGAVLVLSGRGDKEDELMERGPGPAPWWPDFERDFQSYARRHSRPRVRI
jgi:hypothetical protein